MTEWLARICARRAIVVLGIWALLAIVGGILGDDAALGLNLGPTDFLDSATTTEFKLGGGAQRPPGPNAS